MDEASQKNLINKINNMTVLKQKYDQYIVSKEYSVKAISTNSSFYVPTPKEELLKVNQLDGIFNIDAKNTLTIVVIFLKQKDGANKTTLAETLSTYPPQRSKETKTV